MDHPPRVVVLVEGDSDAGAVRSLARCRGFDLDAARVRIEPMGGATGIGRAMARHARAGDHRVVLGLYDIAELPFFARAATAVGPCDEPGLEGLAELGFHACDRDLESELIHAIGVVEMERFIAGRGDLARYRKFQRQPHQRARPAERQLHRFIGTTARRKTTWAPLLVEHAHGLGRVPPPLAALHDDIVAAAIPATPTPDTSAGAA